MCQVPCWYKPHLYKIKAFQFGRKKLFVRVRKVLFSAGRETHANNRVITGQSKQRWPENWETPGWVVSA